MKYDNKISLDEILERIDSKYSKEEQNDYANILLDGIGYFKNEGEVDETFDPMAYLAEYFSTGEYREWLIDTFLADEDEVLITCVDGSFRCVKRYDCELGDIIDIYDIEDECVGFIRGNLDDFTESELMDAVEKELGY